MIEGKNLRRPGYFANDPFDIWIIDGPNEFLAGQIRNSVLAPDQAKPLYIEGRRVRQRPGITNLY
jgi:hypothetical protein